VSNSLHTFVVDVVPTTMMFLKSALTLFLATSASAFFVTPGPGAVPRHFVSRHVSLSDPAVSSEVQAEDETPAEVAAPVETPVAAASEELQKPPSIKNTERHTIYVGNLPYGIALDAVRDMFAEFVTVKYVNLPRNSETGEIKGFAFIDVESEDDIAAAVNALNGMEIGDRPLRVSKSLEKGQIKSQKNQKQDDKNKLFVGNLPFKATVDDVKDLFSQHGKITDVFIPMNSYGDPRGFAFVTCAQEDLEAVMAATDGAELMGRTLSVNPPLKAGEKEERKKTAAPRRQKLYVGNLSFYTTEETLTEVFEEFGEVFDCYIPEDPDRGSSRGFGFVTMSTEAGTEAVEALDGCELDGRIISVNEAQAKRKTSNDYNQGNNDEDSFEA